MDYRRDSLRVSDDEDSLWANISNNLTKLEKIEDEVADLSRQINQQHELIHQTNLVTPEIRDKLKNLYKKALDQTSREEEMANTISKDIDKFLASQSQVGKQSLKVASSISDDSTYKKSKKRDHESASLSGGVNKQMKKSKAYVILSSGNIIKNGTNVAAKQPKSKDPEENWILATVVDYRVDTKQ
ncbi:15935_t:CDS:2 [Acaulospora colombiana]|uniref:15935_t:CDS:1 n=1 Tax=Acaulospora colombiana TaxID=27376 RepID=A0ACA9LES5_9GLOM|nr:15935_t:CDS:2 [Acaulospora colombiana]